MTEDDGSEPYYRISLAIRHPNMDPADITRALGLRPTRSWLAGSERRTPAGTRLSGINVNSYWTTGKDAVGKRAFFDGVIEMIQQLESLSDFLGLVTSTGGTVDITVNLPGRVNVGDTIAASDLARLSRLNVNLGVEVFPHFEIRSESE